MRHRTALTVLATLLLALTALPGLAQEPEAYRAESDAAGVELEILDTDPIRVADAAAAIDTTPLASARGMGLSLSEESRASAEVTTRGEQEQTGQQCLVPQLPGPLAAVLDIEQVCASARANLISLPGSLGQAELAAAAVDGASLAALLAEVALEPIEGEAAAAFDEVQQSVLAPILGALGEACTQLPGGEELSNLTVEQIAGILTPIVSALPQDDPCTVLFGLLTDPPVIDDSSFITDLTAALEAAIAEIDGVAIAVASEAAGEATAAAAGADATYTTVTAELPSLAFLSVILDTAVQDVLQPFLDELTERLSGVTDTVGALPTLAALVEQLRGLLDLSILTDPDPLARLEVLGSEASASFDRATGEVTTSGSAGLVKIQLSQALADLFGVERTQTVEAEQSQTILEGTPLESSISVGGVETTEVEHEGLPGERVEAQSAELVLLTGAPGGGVRVALGTVSAAAYGRPGVAAAPGPEQPLPATGGGAAFAALALLGAGFLARRRS